MQSYQITRRVGGWIIDLGCPPYHTDISPVAKCAWINRFTAENKGETIKIYCRDTPTCGLIKSQLKTNHRQVSESIQIWCPDTEHWHMCSRYLLPCSINQCVLILLVVDILCMDFSSCYIGLGSRCTGFFWPNLYFCFKRACFCVFWVSQFFCNKYFHKQCMSL